MKGFKSSYDSISVKDVDMFRKKYKLPMLPIDYVEFMVSCNGGVSRYDTFSFEIEGKKEESIISFFYSISHESNESDGLDYAMSYSGRYPGEMIPIACDCLGNAICLGVKGKDKGRVFVWIHDMVEEEDKWASIFLVSENFKKFIDSLTPSGVNEDEKPNELYEDCKAGENEKIIQAIKDGIEEEELRNLAKICAYYGHLSLIKVLADNGCDMKMLAFIAMKGRQTDTALYLLENHEDVKSTLPDKSTWLHKAVEYDNYNLVKKIIGMGCDVNVKDHRGFTPLSRTMNKKIIELLKNAGGDL